MIHISIMNSDRQLRCAIRAPVKYSESGTETPTSALLMSMHLARGQLSSADPTNSVSKSPSPSFRRVQITREPEIIEFDPTLPPADFSTLPEPWPKRQKISPNSPEAGIYSVAVDRSMSNCESNLIYSSNMAEMGEMEGQTKAFDVIDNLSISDSDDEPIDDQEALGRKIVSPTWNDLNPAIQLQIVCGLLKHYNWENSCIKLGLGNEERSKLSHYLNTRDQQICREDRSLAAMREKQLTHIMSMDQSVLKHSPVPHQLVLNRISQDFQKCLTMMAKPELEYCRADDILAARQFLRDHDLNENLAGQWGSPLVELAAMPRTESHDITEEFQWKEDWTIPACSFIKTQGPIRDCVPGRSFNEMPSSAENMFVKNAHYSTINPRDTYQGDRHLFTSWTEHTPFYLCDEFQEARMKVREHIRKEMPPPLDGSEFTRIQVGPRQEARVSLGLRDRVLHNSRDLLFKRRVSLAAAKEVQKSHFHKPHVPLSIVDDETPSKLPKHTHKSSQVYDEPVTRYLGGCWSFNEVPPSISQLRFQRQIEEARKESEQKKMKNLARLMEYETSGAYSSPETPQAPTDQVTDDNPQEFTSAEFMHSLPGLDDTFFGTYPTVETDWMALSLPDDYFPNDTLFNPYMGPDQIMLGCNAEIDGNYENSSMYEEKNVPTMWQGPMNI